MKNLKGTSMRTEMHNLDGQGEQEVTVYDMPANSDYWLAVTDVVCPKCKKGKVLWAEAGHVPGYRICNNNQCGQHFLAKGSTQHPTLVEFPDRVGFW
jgi:hypothetical protein